MSKSCELPPAEYLMQVADHCSDSVSIYLMLWRDRDAEGIVNYTKDFIEDAKCIDWVEFKKHLRQLAYEGVIERVFDGNNVTIILAEWQSDLEVFL